MIDVIVTVEDAVAETLLSNSFRAGSTLVLEGVYGVEKRLPYVYYCRHAENWKDNRWFRAFKGQEPLPKTKLYLSTCTTCWYAHISVFPVDEEPEDIEYKCRGCGQKTRRTFVPWLPPPDEGVRRAQEAELEPIRGTISIQPGERVFSFPHVSAMKKPG